MDKEPTYTQEELKALIQETSRRKGRESITPTLF